MLPICAIRRPQLYCKFGAHYWQSSFLLLRFLFEKKMKYTNKFERRFCNVEDLVIKSIAEYGILGIIVLLLLTKGVNALNQLTKSVNELTQTVQNLSGVGQRLDKIEIILERMIRNVR